MTLCQTYFFPFRMAKRVAEFARHRQSGSPDFTYPFRLILRDDVSTAR